MPKPRPALFKWRHFEPEIIFCAVRWCLRFSLGSKRRLRNDWRELLRATANFSCLLRTCLPGLNPALLSRHCALRDQDLDESTLHLAGIDSSAAGDGEQGAAFGQSAESAGMLL